MADMTAFGRGLTGACAHCGGRGIFKGFGLKETCPTCGHRFEREQGYWLGSITINTAVSFALFGIAFLAIALATWPDVPWTGMWIGLIVLMGVFPIIFHPISKAIWVGLDLAVRPIEPSTTPAHESHTADPNPPRRDN